MVAIDASFSGAILPVAVKNIIAPTRAKVTIVLTSISFANFSFINPNSPYLSALAIFINNAGKLDTVFFALSSGNFPDQ